ncbi:MAG TPA: ParM/StbA family protein [Anaerolineae bacterium]|nr:ParM/StbA family protein [Anaerolineae bacterium]
MTATNQQEIQDIGCDLGHGGVKTAQVRMVTMPDGTIERQMVTNAIPSVVAVGSTTSTGALKLDGIVRTGKDRATRPDVVTFDGTSYLAGHSVGRFATPVERMDFDRFTEGTDTRALLYAALWPFLNGGSHTLKIALALPVEILLDRAQARTLQDGMTKWMVGTHNFTLNGTPAIFDIAAIRATAAQPLAGWFSWGLNLSGQWCQGSEAARAPTLIIDIGFNTLDLVAIEAAQVSTRYTGGENLGMRRTAELITHTIHATYGLNLTLYEADALTRAIVNSQKAHVYVAGQVQDVTQIVRQALQTHGTQVVRYVEQRVDKARQFHILLVGGGALAHGQRLRQQWPHAQTVEHPVTANAEGLAKMATRANYFK